MVGLCWKRLHANQPEPSRDPAETQLRHSRSPAETQPKHSRSPAEVQPRPSQSPAEVQQRPSRSPAGAQPEPSRSPAEAQSLSVQQHEGLEPLGDISAVRQAMFDDGARSQTLQGGVVDGLDQVLGHLLLVQQIAGRLLEGVGAVEVRAAGDQQVHDVGVVVGRRHVERAVVVLIPRVHVRAALQQDRRHLGGGRGTFNNTVFGYMSS